MLAPMKIFSYKLRGNDGYGEGGVIFAESREKARELIVKNCAEQEIVVYNMDSLELRELDATSEGVISIVEYYVD